MSDEFAVDQSQIHLHIEANRLDNSIISQIEASLNEPEKKFYEELKGRTIIRFWNRRRHDATRSNLAFTYSYNTHHDIWLAPDDQDLKDTFLHELGQAYNFQIGYRGCDTNNQSNRNMKEIAAQINNAFIGAIAEFNLERKGIDRSYYKTQMNNAMQNFLGSCPPVTPSNLAQWKTPLLKSQCVYMYVVIKLILREGFAPLEELWQVKIKVPEIRILAKNIYNEATRIEITPKRYSELQKIFATQLGVRNYVETGRPSN